MINKKKEKKNNKRNIWPYLDKVQMEGIDVVCFLNLSKEMKSAHKVAKVMLTTTYG